jgi:hypothetical protein
MKAKTPYDRAVSSAIQIVKKKGYITQSELNGCLDKIMEKQLFPKVKAFNPPGYDSDTFAGELTFAWYNYLEERFSHDVKNIQKKNVNGTILGDYIVTKKDRSSIPIEHDYDVTVYALDDNNLTKGIETELSKEMERIRKMNEKITEDNILYLEPRKSG